MKHFLAVTLLLSAAANAGAQGGIRVRNTDPAWWFGVGAGMFAADAINDGSTNSRWDFASGNNIQYRASLEKGIRNQTAVGITATYVNEPFTYYNTGTVLGATCGGGCNAHMKFYSAALNLHVGGTTGFHQVLEATAGVNYYRDLKRDDNGAALPPTGGDIDPAFTFGYGFGYNFSLASEVFVVQDYGLALHQRTNLGNNQSNTLTMRTTRLGFRMGVGSQPRVR